METKKEIKERKQSKIPKSQKKQKKTHKPLIAPVVFLLLFFAVPSSSFCVLLPLSTVIPFYVHLFIAHVFIIVLVFIVLEAVQNNAVCL